MNTTAQRKIKSYVGFAIKSGNVVYGADVVVRSKKKAYIVLLTDTINRTARSRINSFVERSGVKLAVIKDSDMEDYVNKTNCKCIAVTDKNLAEAIINSL